MATGLTGPSASPLAGRTSPADPSGWLHGPLSNTFFSDPAFDDPLTLTEEQRIFDALGDDAGFAESLLSENPDDKEVILAAAQAAGLHKGNIRRTAFSMNDLQALQPPGPPSPEDSGRDLPASSSGLHLKLESVPEHQPMSGYQQATPMDASNSAGVDLGRSSLEQHRMDAMHVEPSSPAMDDPFDMPGSLFTGGTPTEDALPHTHLGVAQGSAHAKGAAPIGGAPDLFGFYSAHSPSNSGAGDGPASPMAKAASTEEVKMLQPQQQQQQQQQQGPATLTSECFPPRASQMPKSMRMSEERERSIRRSQSAIELRTLGTSGSLPRQDSDADLSSYDHVGIELTTPEGHTYHVGRLSNEDRAQKILRYRQKRHERNFSKRIKYQCRKTLADSRPRVRGRFARNNDVGAVMPHETKKAQAERAKRRAAGPAEPAASIKQEELFPGALDGDLDGYGSFGTDDLLPASALPMGDLPPLPELSSLMQEFCMFSVHM
ncbi:hypothetical protein WJX73_008669 [Symbiochloris irregularis]|uniref:CCT domain-containing protein n=1 Tax=Symbiochloris irregularis TaxID=706552 RepID=A0AAW1NRY0_9CHLO